MPRKYESLSARLLANIEYVGDCWLWFGSTGKNGYGKITFRAKSGPNIGVPIRKLVHRVAYEAFGGKRLRRNQVVKHLCNNPRCINPAHLEAGTQRQNIRQCVAEGRHYTPFRLDAGNTILPVEASWTNEYKTPEEAPPPVGRKINLLTEYGVAVLGTWGDGRGLVAWAPLLKIPQHIKERLA